MNELALKVLEANKKAYRSASNPLKSHGPDHHLRVYDYAMMLASKLNADYDSDIPTAAALLHDLAAYYPEESGEKYHEFDAQYAREVLTTISFPPNNIELTLYAIANHGSDSRYNNANEPVEVAILRDADKLDVFGPIGVARIIMVRTLKGDTLQDIVNDFYTNGHLEQKWKSIEYDVTRTIAANDYEYSVSFFKRLSESLTTVE